MPQKKGEMLFIASKLGHFDTFALKAFGTYPIESVTSQNSNPSPRPTLDPCPMRLLLTRYLLGQSSFLRYYLPSSFLKRLPCVPHAFV